jgi:uncharacterized phiE125 gp8 family phage protein
MVARLVKKSNQNIVSLEEAKEHLRVLHTHEDMYIDSLLQVITDSIENDLDKDLVDTDYVFAIFDKVVVGEEIYFPNSPIYNVTSVQFLNGTTAVSSSLFEYTSSDEYIKFSLLPEEYSRINITYKKGFEDSADLPQAIKQAALILLSDLFTFRGSLVIGKTVVHLDKVVQRLLQPYKQVRFL